VRRDGPPFGLKHDGRGRGGDFPQQVELLVRQRAAGRVVPELKVPAAHFTDAIRELEPGVPGERKQRDDPNRPPPPKPLTEAELYVRDAQAPARRRSPEFPGILKQAQADLAARPGPKSQRKPRRK
jgi:hypothetical protein